MNKSTTALSHRSLGALIGAALLLAAGACSNNKTLPPGGAQLDPLPGDQYPKVEAAEGLSKYLVVSGAEVTPASATSPMKVVVAIRSQTEYQEIEAQYRFFFFDEKNRPLDTQPDWRRVRLPSRSQVFLEGGAMETNAADWRLQIRPAR